MNPTSSRALRNATAVLLFLAATSALAAEGILVADVPPGLGTPAILAAARHALVEENWTVLGSDETSVDAERKQGGNDGRLTIFAADGILKYRGAAKVPQVWGAGKDAKFITVDGPVPEKWLDDLRADIKHSLVVPASSGAATRDTAPPGAAAHAVGPQGAAPAGSKGASDSGTNASTADKLRELESLRKEGLISEPEYHRMRQAVLDAF